MILNAEASALGGVQSFFCNYGEDDAVLMLALLLMLLLPTLTSLSHRLQGYSAGNCTALGSAHCEEDANSGGEKGVAGFNYMAMCTSHTAVAR